MLTLAFIAVAGALVSVPALAKSRHKASSEVTLQTVVVTGSMIKRTDKETPSPVQVISDEDLKSSGYTNVSDALSNLAANGQGTLNQGLTAPSPPAPPASRCAA